MNANRSDCTSHCKSNSNPCIACTVQQCVHHCGADDHCSLDRIIVGTHEYNPTEDQCTDCKSFRKK